MNNTQEPGGILLKTSLIDFPDLISCVFFLPGCNLKCPYCYNKELVLSPQEIKKSPEYCTVSQLYEFLEKRRNVLKGLVLSGGEALLHPELSQIISTAKKKGYKVKLDTNGMCPQNLNNLFSLPETTPDYIALDIKTSPEKYTHLIPHSNLINQPENLILETLKILSSHPHEIRTVLVPGLINEEDIKNISFAIKDSVFWYFAHFENNSCINPKFQQIKPYSKDEELKLFQKAKEYHKNSFMR